jgi:hypothetical protein
LALRPTDIEACDQPVLDPKNVTDHLIRQYVALKVAHDLVNFDDDFSVGAGGEGDGRDVRIDHRPLARPIAAHAFPSTNVAAFHPICPHDVLVHGCEHSLHVSGVEPVINEFEKFHLVEHSDLHSPSAVSKAGLSIVTTTKNRMVEIVTTDIIAEAIAHRLNALSHAVANSDIKPHALAAFRQGDL